MSVQTIPKAELHMHIDGAIEVSMTLSKKLAQSAWMNYSARMQIMCLSIIMMILLVF